MSRAGKGGVRVASHAGSWYKGDGRQLGNQLAAWLQAAREGCKELDGRPAENLQAIISPHAGYDYSGSTAAYAYAAIDPSKFDRVLILGPSHHVHLDGCALSAAKALATPVGTLQADIDCVEKLYATGRFDFMSKDVDEDEHSIEMQLPFVAQVFREHLTRIKVVTVLVGSLEDSVEARYGQLFSPYLSDPTTLVIVSSDFCHWGSRFRYTVYDKSHGEIYQFIEAMDRMGMDIIEQQDPQGFQEYRDRTRNTICGRHPIAVFLFAVQRQSSPEKLETKFVRYKQSSSCTSFRDSSVSYASSQTIRRV